MGLQKDLNLLVPVVKGMCIQLESEAREAGIEIGWNETRRVPLIQSAYHAQGREGLNTVNAKRTAAGLWLITAKQNERKITNAIESIHFYDCAADFFLIIDGKPSWNDKADINENDTSDYEEVGVIAEKLGMEWGGRFSFRDLAHVQFLDGLTKEQLRAGVRPQAKTT